MYWNLTDIDACLDEVRLTLTWDVLKSIPYCILLLVAAININMRCIEIIYLALLFDSVLD